MTHNRFILSNKALDLTASTLHPRMSCHSWIIQWSVLLSSNSFVSLSTTAAPADLSTNSPQYQQCTVPEVFSTPGTITARAPQQFSALQQHQHHPHAMPTPRLPHSILGSHYRLFPHCLRAYVCIWLEMCRNITYFNDANASVAILLLRTLPF